MQKNKGISAIAAIAIFLFLSSSSLAGLASGASLPTVVVADGSPLMYFPAMPVWNPFSASNLVGSGGVVFEVPLAMYNPLTNAYIPIAASGWDADYSNNTLIVYLRKGLYWYNGSATIPFTAWDVYADFYIGEKAFNWNAPFLNASGVRVLNNYAIEFVFKSGMYSQVPFILTTILTTPYPV